MNTLLKKKGSLQQYLLRRLGAIVLCLAIVLGGLFSYLLFYSHDDSAEYYMQYEAITLSEAYTFGAEIIEFDPQVKEYYWQQQAMPENIRILMDAEPAILDKLNWYQTDQFDVYIYPHQLEIVTQTLWVVHYFARDDLGETFYFNRNLAVTFTLVFVFLLLVTVILLSMFIGRQMKSFGAWVADSRLKSEAIIAPNFAFDELQQAAFALAKSIESERLLQIEQQQQVEREKAFLSTLSHELRTPMAVINAAIALMNKRGELTEKDAKALSKLNTANDKMKMLSTTLLALWRRQQENGAKSNKEFELGLWVEQAIEGAKQYNDIDVWVSVNNSEEGWQEMVTVGDRPLLQLLLDNLLRNSAQYSADGAAQLCIEVKDDNLVCIKVTNLLERQSNQTRVSSAYDYGYGLGLYLVGEICQQQGWQFGCERMDGKFVASVDATSCHI